LFHKNTLARAATFQQKHGSMHSVVPKRMREHIVSHQQLLPRPRHASNGTGNCRLRNKESARAHICNSIGCLLCSSIAIPLTRPTGSPIVSLKEGLTKLVDWYTKQERFFGHAQMNEQQVKRLRRKTSHPLKRFLIQGAQAISMAILKKTTGGTSSKTIIRPTKP
jgi:hypothetical protein